MKPSNSCALEGRGRSDRAAAQVKTAQRAPSSFLAGGTTLVDLMKLDVETPAHSSTSADLPLDKIEATPDGGLRIGATGPQHRSGISSDRRSATTRCSRRRCSPAHRRSCATWRRPAATCCSAPAACTSATRVCRATSASPAPAARRSAATTGCSRSSARASTASRRTRPTWTSR